MRWVRTVRANLFTGESKLNAFRLINLAVEGITSFSTAPLRLANYVGFAVALLAFVYSAFISGRTLIHGIDVPGYASVLSAALFMSGLQLMALGVIGEYVGRTYFEAAPGLGHPRHLAYRKFKRPFRRVWRVRGDRTGAGLGRE